MNSGDVRQVAVSPLTVEQRQRLECMTAVRGLWSEAAYDNRNVWSVLHSITEIMTLTDYLLTGTKP